MPRSKEAPHLRIRFDPKLMVRLEGARKKSGRTMTGEISERLERSFQQDDVSLVRTVVSLLVPIIDKAEAQRIYGSENASQVLARLIEAGVDIGKLAGGKS
jgi:hypothetical protein